jgi:hypothetical protein
MVDAIGFFEWVFHSRPMRARLVRIGRGGSRVRGTRVGPIPDDSFWQAFWAEVAGLLKKAGES